MAAVSPAQAYQLQVAPRLTEGNTVRYHNATGYLVAIRNAARAINRADVGVRLVPTTRRGEAHIRFSYMPIGCRGSQRGEAHRGDITIPRGCPPAAAAHAALHELGHALGLGHEDTRCAVMNSWWADGKPKLCRRFSWKRPLQADDIAGLRAVWLTPLPGALTPRIKVADDDRIRAGEPIDFLDATIGSGEWVAKWDFGDGATAEGPAVVHAFSAPGTYWVRLQVASGGRVTSVAELVTVAP